MRQLSLIFFLLLSGAFIFSCNNITQKNFEFFYYPSRNVYYDVTNNMFFYSLDGGKIWDSLKTKMDKDPATLGAKQIVYSSTPAIWLQNQQHINQFNGHAINITNNDSDSFSKDLAAERKIKKASDVTTQQNKKPEKKLTFFQRLFGKKNKN
jgi:hypothetical protein